MKAMKDNVFVDTHAHIDMIASNDTELALLMERARKEAVAAVLSVGIDIDSSKKAAGFARSRQDVFAAVGIHPNDASVFSESSLDILEALAAREEVKAWGEIGLDFYRDYTPRHIQYEALEAQLDAASKISLPVIIHAREAMDECIDIISAFVQRRRLRGVFHCFSGDVNDAKRVLDLGFFVSFTGIVTFANAEKTREVAGFVPLDKLLIETDAPFLSPVPFRGRSNEPARVRYVAEAIAKAKKLHFEEVASCTTRNARALFTLPAQ